MLQPVTAILSLPERREKIDEPPGSNGRASFRRGGPSLLSVAKARHARWQISRERSNPMPDLAVGGIGPRILVVAPHPDDESLGVGGLMQAALAAGSSLRVVFMTNGDGFQRGARKHCGRLLLRPSDFIGYGGLRQQEALAALTALGLSHQQAMFLGYPDKGLTALWLRHWEPEHPYTSRYTRCSFSPYEFNYQPKAPYTAPSVLGNLGEILREFRPTGIFVTDPHDTHPDHQAAYTFIKAAALQLAGEDNTFQPEIYKYLIHYGTWQAGRSMSQAKPLVPPSRVCGGGATWYRYLLSPGAVAQKKRAIAHYGSQVRIMRRYMFNFVRINEIFATPGSEELAVMQKLVPPRVSRGAS